MIKVRLSDFNPACNYRLPKRKYNRNPLLETFHLLHFQKQTRFLHLRKVQKMLYLTFKGDFEILMN